MNDLCDSERYEVMLVDPPWNKRKGGRRKVRPYQGRALDYATLQTDQIFALLDARIFRMATPKHCVFMWTIEQYLLACEQEMEKRGYKRHCRFVWDKSNGIAPAFTVRYSHEYLIWYYRPMMLPIDPMQRGKFRTVLHERSSEHSRKPESAYRMIEALYPGARRIDVFSRQRRKGWAQFGDQTDYFSEASCTSPRLVHQDGSAGELDC